MKSEAASLAAAAPRLLVHGGWLAVEVGLGQADAVEETLGRGLWENLDFAQTAGAVRGMWDLAGVRRCVAVRAQSVDAP